jgi:pyruvate formate lyase activating enzyme
LLTDTMGLIFDIKRFAVHDGPGIRTTVFFKGCPLDCWWCHNPESRDEAPERVTHAARCLRCGACVEACRHHALAMGEGGPVLDRARCTLDGACAHACPAEAVETIGRTWSVDELMAELRRDVIFFDQSGGGVTFSGGEPLMQPEFLQAMLERCRTESIRTAVDTSGYAPPDVFDATAQRTDLLLFDLKHPVESQHTIYTGVSNRLILENLRTAASMRQNRGRPDLLIRTPVVPTVNDSDEAIRQLGEIVAGLPGSPPLDLLPYETLGVDKHARVGRTYRLPDVDPPDEARIDAIVRMLRKADIEVTVRGEPR